MILPVGGSGDGWGRSLFGGGGPAAGRGDRVAPGAGCLDGCREGAGLCGTDGACGSDRMPRIDALRDGRYCR